MSAAGVSLAGSQHAARLARGCDRCGAPFVDVARLAGGGELQVCGHHKRALSDALAAAGAVWQFGWRVVAK